MAASQAAAPRKTALQNFLRFISGSKVQEFCLRHCHIGCRILNVASQQASSEEPLVLEQTALIAHNAAFDMRTSAQRGQLRVCQPCPHFAASRPNEMKSALYFGAGHRPSLEALNGDLRSSWLRMRVIPRQAMTQSWDPSIVTPTASSENRVAVIRVFITAGSVSCCVSLT